LTTSHGTADCDVKKECDKLLASSKGTSAGSQNSTTAPSTGQLRHLTEEIFEDAVDLADSKDESFEQVDNDTNDSDLLYFARVSNHYLGLVKHDSIKSVIPRHMMQYPVIVDSGANFHMFRNKEFFTSLLPATGKVFLGDGKTCLPILCVGTVKCYIGVHEHTIENIRYVPTLLESVHSLFLHMKQPEHGIESSFERDLFLKFPLFQTQAVIGINDLYLDAVPLENIRNDSVSRPSVTSSSAPVCCHITDFQKDIMHETDHSDHLLLSLQQYYDTVKTKHQLQFEVPAGFCQESTHQKQLKSFILDQRQSVLNDSSSSSAAVNTTSAIEASICQDLDQDISTKVSEPGDIVHQNINTSSAHDTVPIPIIWSVDKPYSSIPHRLPVSKDFLRASLGSWRIDTIKRHLLDLYCASIRLDSTPADAVLDLGDLAMPHKKARNTTPVPRSSYFGQVMHMDIVFGP
jgi:hypothetical protein